MNILAVMSAPRCFGMQNLTLALFSRLPCRVRIHFLNTRWTDGEFDRRLDALGIPRSSTWFGMFSRKLDRKNLGMTIECLVKLPIAWHDFLRLYWSFRPDVVYLANHHEAILLWPLLIWIRRKVVCHMHDPPPTIFFQKMTFFVWRRAIGRFLVISQSAYERLSLLGRLGPSDTVIHNGVDVAPLAVSRRRNDRFCEMFGWPNDAVIFGITGQLIPLKGHEDFVEAAALAYRQNPRTRFVIGGRGPEEFVSVLRQLIAARGMAQYIGFCGWLPRSLDFYEGIDVLVLASRHEEGFGLVVAEAGERGLATIATRSGGAMEVLLNGETGLLVGKEDPQSIADAMSWLAVDEALRAEMGRRARARIVKEFNLAVQAELVVDFFNRAVCSMGKAE